MDKSDNIFNVAVHPFESPTPHSCAYEILVPGATSNSTKNALLFVGGLGDGPHTVPFVKAIAKVLNSQSSSLGYSVFETRLRSSFTGFGTKSLVDDVEDISALVKYLRGLGKQKIVLMGHSTGSQDCVAYAGQSNQPVDAYILQAPVSDREGMVPTGQITEEELKSSLEVASNLIQNGQGSQIMPSEQLPLCFDLPLTAYRFHSLTSKGGDDDFFSTDLTDEQVSNVWSRFSQPVLIVPSNSDENTPPTLDYAKLIPRWRSLCSTGMVSELSREIPEASHSPDTDETQMDLAGTVRDFLCSLT